VYLTDRNAGKEKLYIKLKNLIFNFEEIVFIKY